MSRFDSSTEKRGTNHSFYCPMRLFVFGLSIIDGTAHRQQVELEFFELVLLLPGQTVLSHLYGAIDCDLGLGIGDVRARILPETPLGKAIRGAHALHACHAIYCRCAFFPLSIAAFYYLDGRRHSYETHPVQNDARPRHKNLRAQPALPGG